MRRPLLILASLTILVSQTATAEFVAPYVQTVPEDVELILDLADVGPDDYLIDLGSGDGRFVIAAGKRGAMAHGVELNPELVNLARANATKAGVTDNVAFVEGDIFEAPIYTATVVTLYLFPAANIQLRPKLLAELRPGTRVVSNSFHMGDWKPDGKAQGRTSGGALLWVIPADVSGLWQLTMESSVWTLTLTQHYQNVTSEPTNLSQPFVVSSIRLRGAKIWFNATHDGQTYRFHGHVEGETMRGSAHRQDNPSSPVVAWQARRVPDN